MYLLYMLIGRKQPYVGSEGRLRSQQSGADNAAKLSKQKQKNSKLQIKKCHINKHFYFSNFETLKLTKQEGCCFDKQLKACLWLLNWFVLKQVWFPLSLIFSVLLHKPTIDKGAVSLAPTYTGKWKSTGQRYFPKDTLTILHCVHSSLSLWTSNKTTKLLSLFVGCHAHLLIITQSCTSLQLVAIGTKSGRRLLVPSTQVSFLWHMMGQSICAKWKDVFKTQGIYRLPDDPVVGQIVC